MSIKNPYEDFTFHGDQYGGYETKGNKEHDAFNEGVKALIAWLDEKCDHRLQSSVGGFFYPDSRRDCPQCWKELKEKHEQRMY